jgi:hypothetical protein
MANIRLTYQSLAVYARLVKRDALSKLNHEVRILLSFKQMERGSGKLAIPFYFPRPENKTGRIFFDPA